MEESGILQRSNNLHMFVLHNVYVPKINLATETFSSAWNNHSMRTEHNWSPIQMWTNGMLDVRNHGRCDGQVVDLVWYGFDPHAPRANDDGLSTVEIKDVEVNIDENTMTQLRNNIDPRRNSDSFGMDLYQEALSFILNSGSVV